MKNRIPMKDDWTTPLCFLNKLEEEFGLMYDPCPLNHTFNGLEIDWKEVNFINPPYSRKLKEAFILKAFKESEKGKVCIMLLPVSTSTKIFHNIIYPNAEIRFIKGRLKFNDLKTSGQMDNMLVIFRKTTMTTNTNKEETMTNINQPVNGTMEKQDKDFINFLQKFKQTYPINCCNTKCQKEFLPINPIQIICDDCMKELAKHFVEHK